MSALACAYLVPASPNEAFYDAALQAIRGESEPIHSFEYSGFALVAAWEVCRLLG